MFKRIVIMTSFLFIDKYLVNKIDFDPLREFFKRLMNPAKEVADILTDANPENTEQLKQFWEKQQLQLLDTTLETAKAIIREKVKDDLLRTAIIALLDEIDENIEGDTPAMRSIAAAFSQ